LLPLLTNREGGGAFAVHPLVLEAISLSTAWFVLIGPRVIIENVECKARQGIKCNMKWQNRECVVTSAVINTRKVASLSSSHRPRVTVVCKLLATSLISARVQNDHKHEDQFQIEEHMNRCI
jgi:hypothetical protein